MAIQDPDRKRSVLSMARKAQLEWNTLNNLEVRYDSVFRKVGTLICGTESGQSVAKSATLHHTFYSVF